MKIHLNPTTTNSDLAKSYKTAIRNAKELYIATAYLTKWSTKIQLNSNCVHLLFLVGTDFGITRKKACDDVLKWLPKKHYGDFLAVPHMNNRGFHPKIIAWKDIHNKCHCIIGSSNLTEAAFNSNYEANVEISISSKEYINIINWLEDIRESCQVIDRGWLAKYKEKKIDAIGGVKSTEKPVVRLSIPNGKKYRERILLRRRDEKHFVEIKGKLIKAMILCSKGNITNGEFWKRFWNLWSDHPSRMQGKGIEFTGKTANWKEACKSFIRVFALSKTTSDFHMDRIIKTEIDNLYKLHNPVRGAWFSEMLCHFFPERYPLLNKPVKIWLKANKWQHQRGLSEGGKYIDLARKLRDALKQNYTGPRNMNELDGVIWWWCKVRGLLDNSN